MVSTPTCEEATRTCSGLFFQGVDLRAADRPGVERGRNKSAGNIDFSKSIDVPNVTHPPGRVEPPVSRQGLNLGEAFEVGSSAGPYIIDAHDDNAFRPNLRALEKVR